MWKRLCAFAEHMIAIVITHKNVSTLPFLSMIFVSIDDVRRIQDRYWGPLKFLILSCA